MIQLKDNQCRAYKHTYKCPKDKCDGCHRRMSRFYLTQEIVENFDEIRPPVGAKTWTDK